MGPIRKKAHVEFEFVRHSLCLTKVYAPNSSTQYPEFAAEANDTLRKVKLNESAILLGDLNAHAGNDAGVWRSTIGRHGDGDVNDSGRLLLQLRCNNALCIINTFFRHRDVREHTWCRDSLVQRSLIDFSIVSVDLLQSVSVGRSCQKGGSIVDWSPLSCPGLRS